MLKKITQLKLYARELRATPLSLEQVQEIHAAGESLEVLVPEYLDETLTFRKPLD